MAKKIDPINPQADAFLRNWLETAQAKTNVATSSTSSMQPEQVDDNTVVPSAAFTYSAEANIGVATSYTPSIMPGQVDNDAVTLSASSTIPAGVDNDAKHVTLTKDSLPVTSELPAGEDSQELFLSAKMLMALGGGHDQRARTLMCRAAPIPTDENGNPMAPGTYFTLFPKLSTEIQYMIWPLTFKGHGRVVDLQWERGQVRYMKSTGNICISQMPYFWSPTAIPVALHVCQASRCLAKKEYKLCFALTTYNPKAQPRIWFNAKTDTLAIACQFNEAETKSMIEIFAPLTGGGDRHHTMSDVGIVQSLAICGGVRIALIRLKTGVDAVLRRLGRDVVKQEESLWKSLKTVWMMTPGAGHNPCVVMRNPRFSRDAREMIMNSTTQVSYVSDEDDLYNDENVHPAYGKLDVFYVTYTIKCGPYYTRDLYPNEMVIYNGKRTN